MGLESLSNMSKLGELGKGRFDVEKRGLPFLSQKYLSEQQCRCRQLSVYLTNTSKYGGMSPGQNIRPEYMPGAFQTPRLQLFSYPLGPDLTQYTNSP